MPIRLFNLRGVPDDEAEDVRALLERHGVDFYETPPGIWGISSPALWLHDKERLAEARELIAAYERERSANARREREELRRSGRAPTIWDEFRAHPVRFVLYVAFALFILYVSTRPFIDFGQ